MKRQDKREGRHGVPVTWGFTEQVRDDLCEMTRRGNRHAFLMLMDVAFHSLDEIERRLALFGLEWLVDQTDLPLNERLVLFERLGRAAFNETNIPNRLIIIDLHGRLANKF